MFKSTALNLWTPNGDPGFRVNVTDIGTQLLTPNTCLSVPNHLMVGKVSFLDSGLNEQLDEVSNTIDEILDLLQNQNVTLDPAVATSVAFNKKFEILQTDVSFIQRKLSSTFPGSRLDKLKMENVDLTRILQNN